MVEMTMMNRTDLPFLVSGRAQFAAALAASGYKPENPPTKPTSDELEDLRAHLDMISGMSTLGIKTLSGMSPKNMALERLVESVNNIHDAEEQVIAVDEILTESNKLYPDQNAYVIGKIISRLMPGGGITLLDRAQSRIGQRVLQAGIAVAPQLASEHVVSDSAPLDGLKQALLPFVQCNNFGFLPNTCGKLEEVGLMEPSSDMMFGYATDTPDGLANWIKDQIAGLTEKQITPKDLSLLLDHAVTLPDDLRGRSLALMVNTFWNATRDAHNEALVLEIGQLIDELPFKLRITALEAYYNQLSLLPYDMARAFHPMVIRSISRLPQTQDFRFNRSCRDLVTNAKLQGDILDQADFLPGETLVKYDQRAQVTAIKQKTFGWAA